MKKFFTYIIISLYLIGSTEAYQLLKIGYLVEHYIEHKNETNLSLLDFIDVHYVQPTVIDSDYAEDMRLPFKSHGDCHAQIMPIAKLQSNDYFVAVTCIETTSQNSQYKSPETGSQFLNEIFQPPRL